MVNVGGKPPTRRRAVAEGRIQMLPETLRLIAEGGHRKGDVLAVARIAAIMAAKRTAELVPLCHPVALSHLDVVLQLQPAEHTVYCRVTAETVANTGVEMEALVGVQMALTCIYDMCKAVDRGMTLGGVRLVEKSGGRSGHWTRHGDGDDLPRGS